MEERTWELDPRWLELSPARRATALARMAAVVDYLGSDVRTAKLADELAARIGVARARFYDLVRIWSKAQSPIALAPFTEPVSKSRSVLPDERVEEITAKVQAVLSGTTDRTPATLVETVAKAWPATAPPPSRATIRRFVKRAISLEGAADGQDRIRREGGEVARAFGEVVVVDHTIADIFVDTGRGMVRPTVALVLDLFTGAPVGQCVSTSAPSASMAREALADAAARTASWAVEPRLPRVVMGSTFAADWTELIRAIGSAGTAISGRRSSRLSFGAPTARLTGGRLGRLRLLARKGHDPAGSGADYDPELHTALSLEQARQVITLNFAEAAAAILGRDLGCPLALGFAKTEPDSDRD